MIIKKKIIVFVVNVDWFFVSHRLAIAIDAIKNGYEVHLICKITSLREFILNQGIIIHDWDIKRSSLNIFSTFFDTYKLWILLKKIKPCLIHAITLKPIIFSCLAIKLIDPTPVIFSISGLGYIFSSKSIKAFLSKFLVKFSFKFIFKNNKQHFIFQNKEDKEKLLSIIKLSHVCNTIIPGSGVDLNYFKPNKLIINSFKKHKVLFGARLLKSKGILEFIEVSKKLKNIDFCIAGKFDKENFDCISESDLALPIKNGNVIFLGYQENMLPIIRESSLVVLPSYYGEGLPKILIEAAACGKPIITTDHPGCRDAVINGVTGILVKPKDIKGLKIAIENLINQPELMRNMSIESRKLAIKKFNIKDVIKKHMEIYKSYIN